MSSRAPDGNDGGDGDYDWPPVSRWFEAHYREISGHIAGAAASQPSTTALSDALTRIILQQYCNSLDRSARIKGNAQAYQNLIGTYDSAARQAADVETQLRQTRSALESAWGGYSGSQLQDLMSRIADDARAVSAMSAVGAGTLTTFAPKLAEAQNTEKEPRDRLFAIGNDLRLARTPVETSRSDLEAVCGRLIAARSTAVAALLAARDGLRSAKRPIFQAVSTATDGTVQPYGPSGFAPMFTFDGPSADAAIAALGASAATLLKLLDDQAYSDRWAMDEDVVGELYADLTYYHNSLSHSLSYLGDRIHQLAAAMKLAGADFAISDKIAQREVYLPVAKVFEDVITKQLRIGLGTERVPAQPDFSAVPADPGPPKTTEPPAGSGPGVAVTPAPTSLAVSGSRRDPDDKSTKPLDAEPDLLRRMTVQHDETAQPIDTQPPVDINPDYSKGAPGAASVPQPAPGPVVTAPH